MKKIGLILALELVQFCAFFYVIPVQKGSNTAVSIEPLAIFPSTDTDNAMIGFGWFQNGFILADQNTTCTFSSVFPVSGEVALNGGSLYLNSDLQLSNIITLTALGSVYGNGHILTMDSGIERLVQSDTITMFNNVDIAIHSDLIIGTTVIFQGSCYLNGGNLRMELDPNIEIIVDSNSTLTLKNLNVAGLHDYNFRCVDDTASIVLDNVSFQLDSNFNFSKGGLIIQDYTEFAGSYTLFFDSTRTLTVNSNSTFAISDGLTLAVGVNNPNIGNRPVFLQDSSSEFYMENSNLTVGPSGLYLARGLISIDGQAYFDAQGTTSSTGFILGTGQPENDVLIRFYPAAQLNFGNSPLVNNISRPSNFESMSNYSKIIRGPLSVFYIEDDVIYSNVTFVIEPTCNLIVNPGVTVGYDNCTLQMPTTSFTISGARLNTYTSLLNGNCEIFLTSGVMPLYTLVQNSNNYIMGSGDIGGEIVLYDNNAQLIFDLDGQMQNNIIMNDSTIILSRNLEFSQNNSILGTGTVNIGSFTLTLGNQYLNWTSPIYWDGNDGTIDINSDLYLSGTWTFSGNCTINGNNNVLLIDPAACIIVERGSTLNLNNIEIYGLQNSNIRCLDSAGTVALDDTTLILSGNYSFVMGSMIFDNLVQITGGQFTFSYATDQVSTINSGGILSICEYMTLDYAPSSAAKNLIQFGCPGSILSLNRATFHSTCTGAQLTTGVLEVNGSCYITSDATCAAQSILFGDGVSAQNDLTIEILDSSCLELVSGCVDIKNLS